jgi:hypothetical protein
MSDTQLLDWLEMVHGQVWFNSQHRLWTCQVLTHVKPPNDIVQPSRQTLRAAIHDAHEQYVRIMHA